MFYGPSNVIFVANTTPMCNVYPWLFLKTFDFQWKIVKLLKSFEHTLKEYPTFLNFNKESK